MADEKSIFVNRVVADLLKFTNTYLWWKAKAVPECPYVLVGAAIRGDYGSAQRIKVKVRPNEINRTVESWVFMPFPSQIPKGEPRRDVHIHCSVLQHAATAERLKRHPKTHQIDVLEVDHWLNKKTAGWSGEQLYSGEWNLAGSGFPPQERNSYAQQITTALALQLLSKRPKQINWEAEIDLSCREIMGADYRDSKPKRKIKGFIITGGTVQLAEEWPAGGEPQQGEGTTRRLNDQ